MVVPKNKQEDFPVIVTCPKVSAQSLSVEDQRALMERVALVKEGIPETAALLKQQINGLHAGLDAFFVRLRQAQSRCRGFLRLRKQSLSKHKSTQK